MGVVTIGDRDKSIGKRDMTWEATWKGGCKEEAADNNPTPIRGNTDDGLPIGAKVGIVSSISVAGLLLIAGAVYLWKRYRKGKGQDGSQSQSQEAPENVEPQSPPPAYDFNTVWKPASDPK